MGWIGCTNHCGGCRCESATAAMRRKENGSGLHQIIVAFTVHAMKGDHEKCLAGEMDGYRSKPIRPQELDEVLARYGARQQAKA